VNPTEATLFRGTRKVWLIDEVDKMRDQDKDTHGSVLAVLNAGFKRGATVERVHKPNFEVKAFPVYGPKVFAGIEHLSDTLADRTFQVRMERTMRVLPRFNLRKTEGAFREIRERLADWASVHGAALQERYDSLPDELPELSGFDDRFKDISEPLVVLATIADQDRSEGLPVLPRLLAGLRLAAGRKDPSGRELNLLAFLDLAERYLRQEEAREGDQREEAFISSEELLQECQSTEALGWIESTKGLAGFLKHFDLCPERSSDGTYRGYRLRRDWIEKWRKSYSPVLVAA
jgi:hypothetical protein